MFEGDKMKHKQEKIEENVIVAFWNKGQGTIEIPDKVRKYTELETWLKDLYESQH